MSTTPFKRIKKFLDERSAMRGIDQNDVSVLHGGDDTREIALTTQDLRELLAENERLRKALNLLRANSSLSMHQLEIIDGALAF
jgi:hypothetical protein